MSILRVRGPYDPAEFALEVPSAQRAVALGAAVMASPWTPPPSLKTNGDIVGGTLPPENYGAYAERLLSFRDFMAENGVPLHAISVQNEPDIEVTYESCDWTVEELASFLREQGPRFGDTRLIAAESFNFNRAMTDPILNDPEAEPQVDTIGGHIYGNGLLEYPLARELGKEVWMTEHYTSSSIGADVWPDALAVAKEIHDSMSASFSAYIWWYIRRSYGPITVDGLVSKRGQLLAQYAKFVRPGDVRVAASAPPSPDVFVTAYKRDGGGNEERLALVAVNLSTEPQSLEVAISGTCVDGFAAFTTSELESVREAGRVPVEGGRLSITLAAQSAATFVSE